MTRAGAIVIGPIARTEEALRRVRGDGFDLAVLDINLGGDLAYPVADALLDQGVPFMFASAYSRSEIPSRYRHNRLVMKPYDIKSLLNGLVETVQSLGRPSAEPAS